MARQALMVRTSDDVLLEAELDVPADHWAAVVLAHPHPLYGGDMHSLVTDALFRALPTEAVAVLRFNFRGVGRSRGTHGGGVAERADVAAALDEMAPVAERVPFLLSGYSFGADVSLHVTDERLDGWFAVNPPLSDPVKPVATDPRPKRFAVGEHDQFNPPDTARARTADWLNTTVVAIAGGDHFMAGATPAVVAELLAFARELRAKAAQ